MQFIIFLCEFWNQNQMVFMQFKSKWTIKYLIDWQSNKRNWTTIEMINMSFYGLHEQWIWKVTGPVIDTSLKVFRCLILVSGGNAFALVSLQNKSLSSVEVSIVMLILNAGVSTVCTSLASTHYTLYGEKIWIGFCWWLPLTFEKKYTTVESNIRIILWLNVINVPIEGNDLKNSWLEKKTENNSYFQWSGLLVATTDITIYKENVTRNIFRRQKLNAWKHSKRKN